MDEWTRADNPVQRVFNYLVKRGWWDLKQDAELKKKQRTEVLRAFNDAEKRKKPPVGDLFTDVYDEPSKQLLEQKAELDAMIAKYPGRSGRVVYQLSRAAPFNTLREFACIADHFPLGGHAPEKK